MVFALFVVMPLLVLTVLWLGLQAVETHFAIVRRIVYPSKTGLLARITSTASLTGAGLAKDDAIAWALVDKLRKQLLGLILLMVCGGVLITVVDLQSLIDARLVDVPKP